MGCGPSDGQRARAHVRRGNRCRARGGKPSRDQRAGETRGALIRAAPTLFAEHGFVDIRTEAIVRAARVTRGALYHHFKDKRDLFEAVFEDVEREFVTTSARRTPPGRRLVGQAGRRL